MSQKRHLIKPTWMNNELVIKTAIRPKGPSLPSRRPFASVYELAKYGLKSFGYYQEIQKYDPGYYVQKYTYKPRKRLAGYLGQTVHSKKNASNYKFGKTYSRQRSRSIDCQQGRINSKSCYGSQQYS